MSAIFSSFYKNTVTAGTPVVLGASTIEFNSCLFFAQKADDTVNTGRIWIGDTTATARNGFEIWPGVSYSFVAPAQSIANAAQFYLDSEVSGDGVSCAYILADWKAFSDIESKIEEACKRYIWTIAATIDDCSVTCGITDDERTEDNVNAYVAETMERFHDSGQFDSRVTIQVRTNIGKAGEQNRLQRHRLRTAYVRDLFMDVDAEATLSSLVPAFSVARSSIRNIQTAQRIEGRQWVSEMTFELLAVGSDYI